MGKFREIYAKVWKWIGLILLLFIVRSIVFTVMAPLFEGSAFYFLLKEFALPSFMVVLAVCLFVAYCSFGVLFELAGLSRWQGLIPFYNLFYICDIAGASRWYLLSFFAVFLSKIFIRFGFVDSGLIDVVYLINIASLVLSYALFYHMSRNFSRGVLFSIGAAFFPIVFFPIIAATNSLYIGNYKGKKYPDEKSESIYKK